MLPLAARKEWLRELPFWLAATVAGFTAVGFAVVCKRVEEIAAHVLERHPYGFLALAPIALLGAWAVVYFLAPEARGSGIPQVMAAVEIQSRDETPPLANELLSVRTIVVKMISAVLCLLGGGAIGREGPTIQIAAGIFKFFGTRFRSWNRSVRPEVWMVTGSAAGIAAAFNTPLGGLVFAIEELSSTHFASFRASLITAVIISGIAAQWVSGTYLYLGYPSIPMVGAKTILWALFLGGVAGTGGAWFGRILYAVNRVRKRVKSVWGLAGIAAGSGLLIAGIALAFDPRSLGAGREIVIQLLFKRAPLPLAEGARPGWPNADFGLAISRFISPILAYISGAAGGIFAPSLAAGGALGSLLADLLRPNLANLFVILGMIGFLTGVTHAPFTAFVLVLEMTDRHTAILPMMTTALVASAVTKAWQPHSFYERVKRDYLESLKT